MEKSIKIFSEEKLIVLTKWVNVFERLNIPWKLPVGISNITADLFLPNQECYIKIIPDELINDSYMICMLNELIKKSNVPTIMAYADGTFRIVDRNQGDEIGGIYDKEETWLSQCEFCGEYFFLQSHGSFECKICGAYEGDHHLGDTHEGDTSLFNNNNN